MKRIAPNLLCLLSLAATTLAQDVTRLERIAPVVGFTRIENGIVIDCQDKSQVQLTVLAPDLIRVRTSFGAPLPIRDHSWAIAERSWRTPHWAVTENADTVSLVTDEVEVIVRKAPLLLEFRDSTTHEVINA